MKILNLNIEQAERITQFDSVGASKLFLAEGRKEFHLNYLHFDANSKIDRHTANFNQIFLVVRGRGWVSADDGKKVEIAANQYALFSKDEIHAKGSETGMDVIMFQYLD